MFGKGHHLDLSVRWLIFQQHAERKKNASQIYKDCFQSCNPIVTQKRISKIINMFDNPDREEETTDYLTTKRKRGGRSEIIDECALAYLRQLITEQKSAKISVITKLFCKNYYGDVDLGPSQTTIWNALRVRLW